jgi:hypothetical protein
MLDNFLTWVADRLKEKSTWIGLVGFAATILGYAVSPESAQAYAEIGLVVGGAISSVLIARKENPKP